MANGFDSHKRWGNSAVKGVGVNSPAMMEARKGFAKKSSARSKALGKKLHNVREENPETTSLSKEAYEKKYKIHD